MSGAGQLCTQQELKEWRDARYRCRCELRLRDVHQALEFVNDVGFCWLFPAKSIEMPTLWEAICGEHRLVPGHHDDLELGMAWDWKDQLPSRRLVFYGKLLCKKPTLVALDLLPYFYALSDNYGDLEDYLTEYQEGRLSDEARRVYEALLKHGALPTSHLRREAGLEGKANATRFDRAIRELQTGLKIVKTGVSDSNAWGYCYVYDLLLRRWPELPTRAQSISTEEAMRTLLLAYLRNVGLATPARVAQVFSWEQGRVAELCERWRARGELVSGVHLEGSWQEHLAWPGLLQGPIERVAGRSEGRADSDAQEGQGSDKE